MRLFVFLIVAVLCSHRSLAADKVRLVNGTAATVGKTLITVQDAYFFRALLRFKEGDASVFTAEEGDELRRTVQKMVFEEMVVSEIRSFKFEAGPRAEVERALQEQRAKGKEPLWKELLARYGKSESFALENLHKSAQVEKFLQKKVDTLTPVVTEAEAERYYKQNQTKFPMNSYERLKPSIILLLKKERLEKGLEEWVRALKDKYGVTNYLSS